MKDNMKRKITIDRKQFLTKLDIYSNTMKDYTGNEVEMVYVYDVKDWLKECKIKFKKKKIKKSERDCEIELIKSILNRRIK